MKFHSQITQFGPVVIAILEEGEAIPENLRNSKVQIVRKIGPNQFEILKTASERLDEGKDATSLHQ